MSLSSHITAFVENSHCYCLVPLLDVPLAMPDARGIPRPRPRTAGPPAVATGALRPGVLGLGVENLELIFEDAGGCSTNEVSVVRLYRSAICSCDTICI
jgi:hypothetical protein